MSRRPTRRATSGGRGNSARWRGSRRMGVQETGMASDLILEQVATGGRIMAVVEERIARARQEMQDAMRRDYAKREREYVSKELWQEYINLTGHEWQGQYDESPE